LWVGWRFREGVTEGGEPSVRSLFCGEALAPLAAQKGQLLGPLLAKEGPLLVLLAGVPTDVGERHVEKDSHLRKGEVREAVPGPTDQHLSG
jgi:hypothetical protein